MQRKLKFPLLLIIVLSAFTQSCNTPPPATDTSSRQEVSAVTKDPLPSWNEGATKKSIVDFVTKTTTAGAIDFIPVADRIACFDNDGTLWSEQPMYFQMAFVMDRVKALAPQHPEWKDTQPFKAAIEGDVQTALSGGEKSMVDMLIATHAGTTTEEFNKIVKDWIATSRHPKTNQPYTEMVYKPMLELLAYLRSNGYKTYIVSGGGIDFMRPWTESVYGIPPEQVIGSSLKLKYEMRDDGPVVYRLPEVNFINDKAGKPVGIEQHIGRRPVFTAGNSDGDYEMLQWTSTATGYPRFGMLVHHTDEVREWAYDRTSHIGKLDKGLNDAPKYNWLIVDMKQDWKKLYGFE
ncbi:MAG: haloacid dehalogenase-like hydrolase [Saprospiraceae bacterium]|nr:haloacid dehalogenase-like hydrolase [Candidatus Opimibacter skivensis]MBL0009778.1 haloacid dehalogenase-like hydrolase [Candidatus Opimibacter skivensis]